MGVQKYLLLNAFGEGYLSLLEKKFFWGMFHLGFTWNIYGKTFFVRPYRSNGTKIHLDAALSSIWWLKSSNFVLEIRSFPKVLWGDLNNFSKLTDKHKKQSSGGVLSEDVFKSFAKFTEKHLCRSLFFNKVTGWKPKNLRISHWRCSVKEGVFLERRLLFQNSRS